MVYASFFPPGISSLGQCHRSCRDTSTENCSTFRWKDTHDNHTIGHPESFICWSWCFVSFHHAIRHHWNPSLIFFVANDAIHQEKEWIKKPWRRPIISLDELTPEVTFFVVSKGWFLLVSSKFAQHFREIQVGELVLQSPKELCP